MPHTLLTYDAPDEINLKNPIHWEGKDAKPQRVVLDGAGDLHAWLVDRARNIPHEWVGDNPKRPLNKFAANVFRVDEPASARTFGILDVDDEPVRGRVLERLRGFGIEHVWHETYSSEGVGISAKAPAFRYRVLVPFKAPASLEQWRAWAWLHVGLHVDKVSYKDKQIWFLPLWSNNAPAIEHVAGKPPELPKLTKRASLGALDAMRDAKKGERWTTISEQYNHAARAVQTWFGDAELLQGAFATDLTEIFDADGGCAVPLAEEFAKLEVTRENKTAPAGDEKVGRGDTNDTLADMFVQQYENRLLFVTEAEQWSEFTPTGWAEPSRVLFNQIIAPWLKQAREVVPGAPVGDPKRWQEIERVIKSRRNMCGSAADFDRADAHRGRLLFVNGLWDLQTGQISQLDPALRWTREACIPAQAPLGPPSGLFREFVRSVMGDSDEMADALLDALAAFMSGRRPHKYLVLYGAGRNGKSLLMDLLCAAFGPGLVRSVSADNARPGKPSYALASIGSARILYLKEAHGVEAATFRAWTGEKTMEVRQIRAAETKIEPKFGLVVTTNDRFPLTTKAADMDRARIVCFEQRFEDDPGFADDALSSPDVLEDVRAELLWRMRRTGGDFPRAWPERWIEEARRWANLSTNNAHVETAKRLFEFGADRSMTEGAALLTMGEVHRGITGAQLQAALASVLGREVDMLGDTYRGVGLKDKTRAKLSLLKRPN